MDDFDFMKIAPRCGGQQEAFEELICQLAGRSLPNDETFRRLRGAGGDGGVECFADVNGHRIGWQAKYVFDIDSLISQTAKSLTTALKIHSTLTRYIVAFPFDLTGQTGRKGRSGQGKFNAFVGKFKAKAASKRRVLTIEPWSASKIRSLLLTVDPSGGLREFFFDKTVLSLGWFASHLASAKATAGPRYTPELNVKTDLWKWFAAFGRTPTWSRGLEESVGQCRKAVKDLDSAVGRMKSTDKTSPDWPEDLRYFARSLISRMVEILDKFTGHNVMEDSQAHSGIISQLEEVLNQLASIESRLAEDLEAKHGTGVANSPGFRQFMAEYMVSFPASNLDDVRNSINNFRNLHEWLLSPAGFLGCERVFVLTGAAGSGKTHGVCDAAHHRFSEGFLSCVTFGHQFRGEPDPWTRLLESLGLPIPLGKEGLLDVLDSAAEASGSFLILFIDAVNETRPFRYWRDRIASFVQELKKRRNLRLCLTCRSSFLPHCLPEDNTIKVVEHRGFAGVERHACKAFFQFYNLKPPIVPILQPELSNPLYLKLVCETLRSKGLDRLPSGWQGLGPVIRAFLHEKERQFASEHETSAGAKIVVGTLQAIAREIANSAESCLSWSRALRVISEGSPQARNYPILEWLIRADLLIEDAPATNSKLGDESTVRPAFERLGDFLIAGELISKINLDEIKRECQPGGLLRPIIANAINENAGIISALSILLPEKKDGLELPNLMQDMSIRRAVLKITVESFAWRDPTSFSLSSAALLREAFAIKGFAEKAMNAALSVSWSPSAIDAIWLDDTLKQTPFSRRDAFWCWYLHFGFESQGPVRRLIDAAFELPLDQMEESIVDRWVTALLWLTASADRRVKDKATRAAVALLTARAEVIPDVLTRLIKSDDDEMRERALLTCYAALIITRNIAMVKKITILLHNIFRNSPNLFDNALIRDHIRCISELAKHLDILPEGYDPELTMHPIGSEWPIDIPSDEKIKSLEKLPKLANSCLDDDFFIYSMSCLTSWLHGMPKQDMAKWILQRVAEVFGYEGSGCEQYDRYMLGKYGGGRAKPKWAERIGKKYQWVAMYQLASRLNDHIKRNQDRWTPTPLRTPLILLEERKLDPTLPAEMKCKESPAGAWWLGSSVNFQANEKLSDDEWVTSQKDLPLLEEMLSDKDREGQPWRLLASYPAWKEPNSSSDDPYRYVWVHVESYLVPRNRIKMAYDCLYRRNFFGRWMPGRASWLYGFAGEYPWGTAYNTEPEEWYGQGRSINLPVKFTASNCELIVEWEYDATLPGNFTMMVPARKFFISNNLWWNGKDGFRIINGKTIFRDPSVKEKGPATLIADASDLLNRLDSLKLSLIWTILGEKLIVGGLRDEAKQRPRRTFSQIARLEKDGAVKIGERVFFEDYDQDTGPLLPKKRPQNPRKRRE